MRIGPRVRSSYPGYGLSRFPSLHPHRNDRIPMNAAPTEADIQAQLARLTTLRSAIAQAIVGQEAVVEQLLIGLLAGGHCLLEGVPGLGKTLLVRTLGEALELQFRRVQFTPDLMPSDILGTELLEEDHGTGHRHFRFQPGPIFTNLLLADELNRTPPKTQAALLEAMQERTVSYAGVTHALPAPFFVLATQNPLEQAGTYPLPEAQLDRFLLHIRVDYPSEREEQDILAQTTGTHHAKVPRVMDGDDVLALQARVREVHLGEDLLSWITRLVRASRPNDASPAEIRQWVKWGAGPRAGQSLVLAAKARALLHGRLAATREDIVALAAPVMRHRLLLSFAAEAEQKSADDVVAVLLRSVPYAA
jgi:MoxR-like ATPase